MGLWLAKKTAGQQELSSRSSRPQYHYGMSLGMTGARLSGAGVTCGMAYQNSACAPAQGRTTHALCGVAVRRHTAGVMGQLWALLLPLGLGGVAIVGQLQGLTAETMGPSQRVCAPPSACSASCASTAVTLQ
jgi:hypothetical protein